MSASKSRAAYMGEYRKTKRLEGDHCNNVPIRRKCRKTARLKKTQSSRKTQENKTPKAGNIRAAYMSTGKEQKICL
jgi:hypothetical protein